jgi:hypothetical protein
MSDTSYNATLLSWTNSSAEVYLVGRELSFTRLSPASSRYRTLRIARPDLRMPGRGVSYG